MRIHWLLIWIPHEAVRAEQRPLLEHSFCFQQLSDIPTHLEIAIGNTENDAFILLLRHDIINGHVKAILFLRTLDYLKTRPISIEEFIHFLDSRSELLSRHPLMLVNVVFEFLQSFIHQYIRWRIALNDMESRLGVTPDRRTLKGGGYAGVSYDFTQLNADLAGLAKRLADSELSASTILELATGFGSMVELCETYRDESSNKATKRITSMQREEVQATIKRAVLYLKYTKMTQQVQQSLAAVLYNRINKQESQSMKTIAVVTLFFLPATFVSSIFSTGIFNFHATEHNNPQTISKYGWVYLLICLLLTALTLACWLCWYVWGRFWLDKASKSGGRGIWRTEVHHPISVAQKSWDLSTGDHKR